MAGMNAVSPKCAIDLAKYVIAFEQAMSVFFPDPARTMAELASQVLINEGILYWIGQGGDSIICVTCHRISFNPHDVANLYCGFCKGFHL